MHQRYRRQLLALTELTSSPQRADQLALEFIRGVLAGPLEWRPDSQGVEDVLASIGTPAPTVACFMNAFNSAVWNASQPTIHYGPS
jgi:hypothetical protein